MCGIVGSYWKVEPDNSKELLTRSVHALAHRGPNDKGVWFYRTPQDTLGLAHTRLSIIDLSSSGHQPMHSSDGRYTLVYNGEIYNYLELRQKLRREGWHFDSNTDTEVLLACWILWGKAALSLLRGMFAFTIHDRDKCTLTCVRDSFGIKPLYYQFDQDSFAFASEIPALLTLLFRRPPLNLQRAYDYLVAARYDNEENTFFEGIYHLLPGHFLKLDLKNEISPVVQQWWWPSIKERTDLSFVDASEQLRGMFLSNVRLHLRSDVPLGAALSGGIDSSALVCAMRHVEPDMPIHTFSYVARGSEVDEEHWVDLINEHVGAIAHKVVVSPEELAGDLDDMIRTQGEPFGSTSIYAQYRVFKMAKDHGIIVTLDGQGADELLAGYNGYPHARMRSLLDQREFIALIRFLRAWSRWPGRTIKHGVQAFTGQFLPPVLQRLALRLIGRTPEPGWLNMEMLRDANINGISVYMPGEVEATQRRLMDTLRHTLTGHGLAALLRHGDRNSMRWSVESRVPFLTIEMAEFLLSLPESYLISPEGETKHVFRVAMRDIVPNTILDRKDKIGFHTPEQQWLKLLGPKVMDWLAGIETLPFLNTDKSRILIKQTIDGKKPFTTQAWRLINYCRWAQIFSA